MEVILLEKIRNLGDKVKVAGGYGRNYLLPYGKAVPANKKNMANFEVRRAELEKAGDEKLAQAKARQEKVVALGTVTITAKAAEEGKLYGSIGPKEVAEAITAAGVEMAKSEVLMPLGHVRETGEKTLRFQLHTDVTAELVISVVGAE